jgi:transcriptional regulator with GAF, ATPase, and Fis domain
LTDAVTRKLGKLEVAEGVTIFLDELGELPLPQQANSAV